MSTLAEKLLQRNHGWFVGRTRELDMLTDLLQSQDPERFLVYFYGPSGIGKTSILREALYRAVNLGFQTRLIDLNTQTSETLLQAVLTPVVPVAPATPSSPRSLRDHFRPAQPVIPEQTVFAFDGLDHAAPDVIQTLLDKVLPNLNTTNFALFASNRPVTVLWKEWQNIMLALPLEPWSFGNVEEYVHRRRMPDGQVDAEQLYRVTGGHPAAVAAACDTYWSGGASAPRNSPYRFLSDIAERILKEDPHLVRLVRAASVPRYFTVQLLEAMLGRELELEDTEALSRLSFVVPTESGLRILECVRRSIYRDFRSREPILVRQLHRHCQEYFEPQDLLEYLYHAAVLAEDEGVLTTLFDALERDTDLTVVETGTMDDVPEMLELDRSVYNTGWQVNWDYCQGILERNPEIYRVLRVGGRVKGYYAAVPLTHQGFEGLLSGELGEMDVIRHVLPYDLNVDVYVYFSSIVVDKSDGSHRHYAARLLQDWLQTTAKLVRRGVRIREIGAFAATDDGERLAAKLGLARVNTINLTDTVSAGIYRARLDDLKGNGLLARTLASISTQGAAE